MKNILLLTCALIIGIANQASAKNRPGYTDSLTREISKAKNDTIKVRLLTKLSSALRGSNVDSAIIVDKIALALARKVKDQYGIAKSLNAIGVGNYFLGNYSEAIIAWQEAKGLYVQIGEMRGVANILSNMGAIYFNQSEYSNALQLYLEALKIAEQEKDTLRIATVLQNIGALHLDKADFAMAEPAFQKAMPLFKSIKNDEGIGLVYSNLGECSKGRKEYMNAIKYLDTALQYLYGTNYYVEALRTMGETKLNTASTGEALLYLDSAYNMSLSAGDDFALARILNTKALAYAENNDQQKALIFYEKAKAMSLASNADNELLNSAKGLVKIYTSKGDYKRAFENQKLVERARDSIYSVESEQKNNKLLFKFDLEKKESEISLLVKDQKIKQVEVEKQKGIRNMLLGGSAVLLAFSFVLFYQRNKVKREKKNVETEKARSEELLLNILPEEVARELKNKGSADAKLISDVTVLFTDFVEFTALSQLLSPQDLVSSLHHCFTAFDHIIESNGMEKIKTIGDAYMAAGGLPTPNTTHARDVVKAALEIRTFMEDYKAQKIAANQPYFEIRIGIHTGPVVAGIVGVKKFSYDIWGDTVNTANRMESTGEVGKVNISETTYELVKDIYKCHHRGKVTAKGKGEIDMYFVER